MIVFQAKFLGCLIGSALGDAIGQLAFRIKYDKPEENLQERAREQEKLVYTDDTAMAIGLAESLWHNGRLIEQSLGDTFAKNYDLEPWRGYAMGPPAIFYQVKHEGLSYRQAASQLFNGTGSMGNGAAMRIAPVGVFFHDAQDLYDQVAVSAIVTHTHPVGVDGAAVLAMAIARSVTLDPAQKFPQVQLLEELIAFARTPELQGKMTLVRQLLADKAAPQQALKLLGSSTLAHESVPYAIYAFLANPKSYQQCLYSAVIHGGDRDTLGAMAGAISGAYLGITAIPQEWQAKLENRELIEKLSLGLYTKWQTGNNDNNEK